MDEPRQGTDALFSAPGGSAASQPSDWLLRFAHLIEPGGVVADVACGAGRHARWLLEQGFAVVAFDRDLSRLELVHPRLQRREVDLESVAGFSFGAEAYDAVLVTNYLWRPLFPALLAAVKADGVFLYETFAREHAALGSPRNPDFLLEPGELLARVGPGQRIVAYEHGYLAAPRPRVVQRIASVGAARDLAGRGLGPAGG
ncbi:MAG: class I SAM-dependent methyltransferase [Polyangiaceae bacterium]